MRLAFVLLAACSSSSDRLPGGDSPDAGGPPDASFAPLAATSFVVVTEKPAGHTTLVGYDIATRAPTKLVDFDPTSSIEGAAISPDRTAIAFTGLFRPEPIEAQAGYPANSLWTVRTDGTTFHRVTSPLPTITPPGAAFHIEMRRPIWSLDGTRLFFEFQQGWLDGATVVGGGDIAEAPVTGALPTHHTDLLGSCQFAGSPAFAPDGARGLFIRSVCTRSADEGVYSLVGTEVTQLLPLDTPGPLHWKGASSTLLVGMYDGIDLVSVPAGTDDATILSPVATGIVSDFAVDPTGRYVALCTFLDGSRALWWIDLEAATPMWTEVPGVLGSSCYLAW